MSAVVYRLLSHNGPTPDWGAAFAWEDFQDTVRCLLRWAKIITILSMLSFAFLATTITIVLLAYDAGALFIIGEYKLTSLLLLGIVMSALAWKALLTFELRRMVGPLACLGIVILMLVWANRAYFFPLIWEEVTGDIAWFLLVAEIALAIYRCRKHEKAPAPDTSPRRSRRRPRIPPSPPGETVRLAA